MFGVPITLNYKEGSTFKTIYGGITSCNVYVIFGILTIFMIIRMVSKTSLNTNQNDRSVDMFDPNLKPIYPMDENFLVAFYMSGVIDSSTFEKLKLEFYVSSSIFNEQTGQSDIFYDYIPLVN